MSEIQTVSVLATDMDGTFIPLEGNDENLRDLQRLCQEIERHRLDLIYVTGRHYELVLDAIDAHALPTPDWLICDVGTTIYQRSGDGTHELLREYQEKLSEIVEGVDISVLANRLGDIRELRLQEPEKQGCFKLSYYCEARQLESLAGRLSTSLSDMTAPYRLIASVDPFTGEGLIDLLPDRVSKDFALRWWVEHTRRDIQSVVFAGDSGNDLAALTAGYRSIVVANADRLLADEVAQSHQSSGWNDRLVIAEKPATSGVLEGLNHFLDPGTGTGN